MENLDALSPFNSGAAFAQQGGARVKVGEKTIHETQLAK